MSSHPPRPDFIRHWTELEGPDDAHYPNSDELSSIGAPMARALGLKAIGIHHDRLLPRPAHLLPPCREHGGRVRVRDRRRAGRLARRASASPLAGDAVGFPAGTGICHTFLNNTDGAVRLLILGEASRPTTRSTTPAIPRRCPCVRTGGTTAASAERPAHGKPGRAHHRTREAEHRAELASSTVRDHEGEPECHTTTTPSA